METLVEVPGLCVYWHLLYKWNGIDHLRFLYLLRECHEDLWSVYELCLIDVVIENFD